MFSLKTWLSANTEAMRQGEGQFILCSFLFYQRILFQTYALSIRGILVHETVSLIMCTVKVNISLEAFENKGDPILRAPGWLLFIVGPLKLAAHSLHPTNADSRVDG